MLEYAIVVGVVSLVVIGTLQVVGHKTSLAFCSIENGLGAAGSLANWGDNSFGQLGSGTHSGQQATPISVNGDCSVAADSGTNHIVILKPDGTVWAWGNDSNGAIGNGSNSGTVDTPTAVPGVPPSGRKVASVAAGTDTSYALLDNGSVQAWGKNTFGDVGNGLAASPVDSPTWVCGIAQTAPCSPGVVGHDVLTGVTKLSAGNNSAYGLMSTGCAVTGQCFVAWGAGASHGQLGCAPSCGANADHNVPIRVDTGIIPATTTLTGGQDHALALTSAGNVLAWGIGTFGVLGDGLNTDANQPGYVQTSAGVSLSGVAKLGRGATSSTAYAILNDTTAVAWGENDLAELGINVQSPAGAFGCYCQSYFAPTAGVGSQQIVDTTGVAGTKETGIGSIARGNGYAIVLLTNGTLAGFGANGATDQLGLGAPSGGCGCVAYVTAIAGVTNAIGLAAGANHTVVLIAPGGTPSAS